MVAIINNGMTRRGVLGWLAAGTAIALSGCSLIYPTATLRYRITVEVDTPEGLKTGSSVAEIKRIEKGSFGDAAMTGGHIRAEAAAVDLPGGRTLFVLLRSDQLGVDFPVQILSTVFRYPQATNALGEAVNGSLVDKMKAASRTKPSFTLLRKDDPLLVTFTDIRDPKTVAKVDPDNMAKSFGPGVTLRRITIQITDDPVTTGIEKRLGWLPQYYDKMLDGSANNNSQALANNLSQIDFVAGVRK